MEDKEFKGWESLDQNGNRWLCLHTFGVDPDLRVALDLHFGEWLLIWVEKQGKDWVRASRPIISNSNLLKDELREAIEWAFEELGAQARDNALRSMKQCFELMSARTRMVRE